MATVIEIVAAHLLANGFDGLVHCESACGCKVDDLVLCAGDFAMCEPAYIGVIPGEPDEWSMYRTKDAADMSRLTDQGAKR